MYATLDVKRVRHLWAKSLLQCLQFGVVRVMLARNCAKVDVKTGPRLCPWSLKGTKTEQSCRKTKSIFPRIETSFNMLTALQAWTTSCRSLNEDVKLHYITPRWGLWGRENREKKEEKTKKTGWPGARCSLWRDTPSPRRHGSGGIRWEGLLGAGGRGGRVLRAAGRPKLWHELPACWAGALEMLDERSRTQWPSNAHTGSPGNNNKALCAPG